MEEYKARLVATGYSQVEGFDFGEIFSHVAKLSSSRFPLSIIDDDPRMVREVMNSEDSKLWKKAMVEEMDSLDKNEAWDIVELLVGKKYVGRKWLFKKKFNVE